MRDTVLFGFNPMTATDDTTQQKRPMCRFHQMVSLVAVEDLSQSSCYRILFQNLFVLFLSLTAFTLTLPLFYVLTQCHSFF